MNQESKAAQYAAMMGWDFHASGDDQITVSSCPFNGCGPYKFAINASGSEKDGLFRCVVCEETGNLYKLQKHTGVWMDNDSSTMSVKDMAQARTKPQPLPNFDQMHEKLFDEKYEDVLEYLVGTRGFSMEVIKRFKLGAATFKSRKYYNEDGETPLQVKCYVIPYFNAKGEPVFFKARTLPVEGLDREFFAPGGRDNPLFNEGVLKPGMDEVTLVEGEADALSLLSQGYENVVGIPGAGMKKALWIERLERLSPKSIYMIYDNDQPGQSNAKDMAIRIGIEKVLNVKLPEFERFDGKKGKDLNEFFCAGHTLEALGVLKEDARPFDVEGVHGVLTILEDLERDIEDNGLIPKYAPHLEGMRKKVGGFDDGDLVGIMAPGKCGKTTVAMNMLNHWSAVDGHTTFLYCNEMSPKRMVRKWVAHVTQTDDNPADAQNAGRMKQAVAGAFSYAREMKGDMLFGYTTGKKPEHVFDTIRQAVKRYGVKIVCFDNLQLLVRSLESFHQETSRITKDFKALAMELQILIILIIQPKKLGENQVIGGDDGSGSGAISKDVDYMITFQRRVVAGEMRLNDLQGFMETDEAFEPQMYGKAALSRYSSGGWFTLFMDGAKSTVRDIGADEVGSGPQSTALIQVEQKISV